MSKNLGIKWYSLKNILKHDVQYYMIFGERSNGKSFAVNKRALDNFFSLGEEFVIMKRYDEDMKSKICNTVFKPFDEYVLEKYEHKIKFYQGCWWAYHKDSEGKMSDCTCMGYALSLSSSDRIKMSQYPKVTTISLEEFMSQSCSYLNDEISLFLNVVSTIVRYRTNVKVFLLANAISKSSPYSSALGLRIHRLKKGEIVVKEFKDDKGNSTKFAIERTENVNVFNNNENTKKVVYNVFGNSGVGKMITSGDFETHAYPRKIDNFTFDEIRSNTKDKIIGKKYATSFILKFEDYYYRIYLIERGKFIIAFREVEEETISPKNTSHIINGTTFKDGIININNLAYYDDENINRIINIFVASMRQKDFITLSDDDGENVTNGFRISGINLK